MIERVLGLDAVLLRQCPQKEQGQWFLACAVASCNLCLVGLGVGYISYLVFPSLWVLLGGGVLGMMVWFHLQRLLFLNQAAASLRGGTLMSLFVKLIAMVSFASVLSFPVTLATHQQDMAPILNAYVQEQHARLSGAVHMYYEEEIARLDQDIASWKQKREARKRIWLRLEERQHQHAHAKEVMAVLVNDARQAWEEVDRTATLRIEHIESQQTVLRANQRTEANFYAHNVAQSGHVMQSLTLLMKHYEQDVKNTTLVFIILFVFPLLIRRAMGKECDYERHNQALQRALIKRHHQWTRERISAIEHDWSTRSV